MTTDTAKTLLVSEIFKSIQGESTRAGLPCIFVRLAGCSNRCTYCDTGYARTGGETMTIGDILAACAAHGSKLVEITGGEPLEQPASADLAKALLAEGYTVLCETSGTQPLSLLPEGVIRVMDLKCPSSGMAERNDWGNIDLLTPRDELKFVLADRADYEWARDVVARYALQSRCGALLFSAVYGVLAPRTLAEWILADGLEVRFQLQLHKYVWPPDQRGV